MTPQTIAESSVTGIDEDLANYLILFSDTRFRLVQDYEEK
jgi:hypothetical protein